MAPSCNIISNLRQIFSELLSLLPLEHIPKSMPRKVESTQQNSPGVEAVTNSDAVEAVTNSNPEVAEAKSNLEAKIGAIVKGLSTATTDLEAKISAVVKELSATAAGAEAATDSEGEIGAAVKELSTATTNLEAKIAAVVNELSSTEGAEAKTNLEVKIGAVVKGLSRTTTDLGAKIGAVVKELSGATGAEAAANLEGKLDAIMTKFEGDEAKAKINVVEQELSKFVGADSLKSHFGEWLKGMFLDESRRALGLKVGPRSPPHMVFIGNRGTGKTTAARTLGKLFHEFGILPTDKVIVVEREKLVAKTTNETVQKTKAKIREAKGGILFINEGYHLREKRRMTYFDKGLKDALEEIRSILDSGSVVVIFSGSNETIENVISSDEGLRRKLINYFYFADFTCEGLAKMALAKLSAADENSPFYGLKLHDSCSVAAVRVLLERETTDKQRREMNGVLVDQMLVKARDHMDSRLGSECKDTDSICKDADSMITITLEDLMAGLYTITSKGKRKRSENTSSNGKPKTNTKPKMDAKAKKEALETELSKIVGMDSLKSQLDKWFKGMIVDEKCRTVGLNVGSRSSPHMVFMGNPGTGKTMVAQILAKLLHIVGIIPTMNVTKVQRTDLVAEYIGQTGPKTRKHIEAAKGGILFVDEAYSLMPELSSRDFGIEAIEEIMSSMDSGDIVVIFAGYSEPMNRVISSNEGFKRRVNRVFNFDDYSCQDLAKIVHVKMSSQDKSSPLHGFKLHPECTVEAIATLIERETTPELRKELNGGLADQMLGNARENFDSRVDIESIDAKFEPTITLEDLSVGISNGAKVWLNGDKPDHILSLYI